MALIQVNYLSQALFRTVPVQVILPCDRITPGSRSYFMQEDTKFPTLYLLHGLLGNYTDWVSGTRIQRWAEQRGLAVVMPSGDNAFYMDGPLPYSRYGEFISRELVEMTRLMFPLSRRREDTFIAGLSMGGYGALVNAMVAPDVFSHAAGLSSALSLLEPSLKPVASENHIFGDPEKARGTDRNPDVALQHLTEKVHAGQAQFPRFYMACGLQDGLLGVNRRFSDSLVRAGADVTYVEEDGGHEWDFWDRQIHAVLDWLPLKSGEAGLSSGHVTRDS